MSTGKENVRAETNRATAVSPGEKKRIYLCSGLGVRFQRKHTSIRRLKELLLGMKEKKQGKDEDKKCPLGKKVYDEK